MAGPHYKSAAAGGTCPSTRINTIDYGTGSNAVHGSGQVYGIGGPGTTTNWGEYHDVTYVADPQLTGIALIRARDLKSDRAVVFIGAYAAGGVVGPDTIDGGAVQQHADLVLDASYHPATSGTSKGGVGTFDRASPPAGPGASVSGSTAHISVRSSSPSEHTVQFDGTVVQGGLRGRHRAVVDGNR